MSLPSALLLTWPQVFALLFLALIGAFLAELLVGNAPKFGVLGALVLAVLGSWLFINLPLDISFEPHLEDLPVLRSILGSLLVVALFAFFRKLNNAR
jgi:uncharacterized membrane protein YeaQ/YmgE (transglycosylase-associated protein family)